METADGDCSGFGVLNPILLCCRRSCRGLVYFCFRLRFWLFGFVSSTKIIVVRVVIPVQFFRKILEVIVRIVIELLSLCSLFRLFCFGGHWALNSNGFNRLDIEIRVWRLAFELSRELLPLIDGAHFQYRSSSIVQLLSFVAFPLIRLAI
ncbi:hypothetical protein BJ742DRAFT_252998 [Cladochytrium replicatum]|nr:hypothetical protein BJ742DRAFT_252998 [Cladochytrium replicatum]